jgi:hypothetical protein
VHRPRPESQPLAPRPDNSQSPHGVGPSLFDLVFRVMTQVNLRLRIGRSCKFRPPKRLPNRVAQPSAAAAAGVLPLAVRPPGLAGAVSRPVSVRAPLVYDAPGPHVDLTTDLSPAALLPTGKLSSSLCVCGLRALAIPSLNPADLHLRCP